VDLDHLNLRVRDALACRDFYIEHFGFRPAFEADGGLFVRNEDGFLLALVPIGEHGPLPDGFHIGFGAATPEEVVSTHARLVAAAIDVGQLDDHRPGEDHVTFRCWDPDRTEIEVFWEGS
jgi:catechol 2,3-dioxygenase-like lactoylglutathione lyase family enzyme